MITLKMKSPTMADKRQGKFVYRSYLSGLVTNVPAGGLTVGQVSQRIELKKKIDGSGDTLKVDDEEMKILADVVANAKWSVVDPAIIEFVNYVTGLAAPKKKEGGKPKKKRKSSRKR